MTRLLKRSIAGAVLLAIIGAGLFYYITSQARIGGDRPGKKLVAGGRAQPVVAGRVVQKPMPVQLVAIGTVQTVNTVAVRTRIDSQITKVYINDGQVVRAGEPLFALDDRQIEAQSQQAEALLARDRLQLELARRAAARTNPSIDSQETIDQARTNVAVLEANVRADEANLQNLGVQRSYTTIRAPIAGHAGTIAYKLGNNVKVSDALPLVTINQISPIYVAFSVPEASLPAVRTALANGAVPVAATLPAEGEAGEGGQVAYIENAVDAATGTFSVKAIFANARERLWPGAFVNVVVTLATEARALVVPAQAVQQSQEGSYLFVIKDDNTVETRAVAVSRTIGGEAVLARGVVKGERIVLDGQLRLVNGTRVDVKMPKSEGKS